MNRYWQQLADRQLDDGGFAAGEGGEYRADATAWAALALAWRDAAAAGRAAARLSAAQLDDGRVPVLPTHPAAAWVTPLAVLAFLATGRSESAERSLAFLGAYSGVHFEKPADIVGHDTSIVGWPWIAETHSWVEPTALSVLAFRVAGRPDHPRVSEGLEMLRDRRLPSGGWNYGNTFTFGAEMRPSPDSTGIALSALPTDDAVGLQSSLAYLERRVPELRTPLSLGWAVMGLSAWQKRPAGTAARIEETLDRQRSIGPFSTTDVALLLAAVEFEDGLYTALTKGSTGEPRQG